MSHLKISLATQKERELIYQMRHLVYACELGQHQQNTEGRIKDSLDQFNEYIVATIDHEIAGFISITLPEKNHYSIDKYFQRKAMPFQFDEKLYEVRLLTVPEQYRGYHIAGILMYAAYRWIESRGGTRIVAIGRQEIRNMYQKAGMRMQGQQIRTGAVTYELMDASISELKTGMEKYSSTLQKIEKNIDWDLECSFF